MTTPSAASTAEELRQLIASCEPVSHPKIMDVLRELAALKESAQRLDSAYARAIEEFQALSLEMQKKIVSGPFTTVEWIKRRAAEIAKETQS